MKEFWKYALVMLAYIGTSFLTKNFLTWTSGPLFFLIFLEVLPRTFRRLRSARPEKVQA